MRGQDAELFLSRQRTEGKGVVWHDTEVQL
jgi:hypothetical protein